MRAHTTQTHLLPLDSAPTIRRADLAEPFEWLAAGIRSFAAAPAGSLLYGTLFALACWLTLTLTWTLPWFALAFLTGLMLLGPFLAAGLYVAARQQDAGEPISIRGSFVLLWERRTNLSLFVLFLSLIAAAWVRLSALLFAIQFTTLSPSTNDYLGLLSGHFDPVVTSFFVGIGLLLAGTVFVTSAVAIPMILDRDVGPIAAMHTSYRTVLLNWPTMLLWAALIVMLCGIGLLTVFIGMIPLFPILGYATWHSYRRMVA